MKHNQILKIYGTDYKENTMTLLEEADLASLIPSHDSRIAIKPNLVTASEASFGATTHPEIVEGLIEYLMMHDYHNLVIMEGSWVGGCTEEAFDVCGYHKISDKYGVPLIDLQKAQSLTRDCAGMQLKITKPVTEADFLINIPVLKGHCQTRITCALKNLKGLIPNSEKRRFHSLGLHKPIAHLAAGIRQDFILVDHICGDLDFEDGGNPVVRNGIFAGRDPVLIDTMVCEMLHYTTKDVPYVELAQKLGVGSTDLAHADIRTIGPRNRSGQTAPVDLPLPGRRVLVEDAVEEVESCSACYAYLIPALSRLHDEGHLEKLPGKICIGQGFRGRTGKLGVGDCTCLFETSIAGCPPTENQIYEALRDYLSEGK